MTIKKGDNIIVLAGKDKGKKSKIVRVFPKSGKVLVEAVNVVKKHQKKRKEGEKGQVVSRPMPIDVSNVLLFCAKCDKGSRAKASIVNSKKLRVCYKCSSEF
ncbi:MAG: 50S ribosomal protein L24 [Candidatus Vogelbacteria bacterium]|nr:50S ribosomal protein L24 [Candidatus Vogelbacteria bacterium]